jgi:hypothetical protein
MIGMMKAVPMLLMVGGVATSADKLKPLIEHSKCTAVQMEVNEITKMIRMDHIVDDKAIPKPETFGEYLKKNMRVEANETSTRDVSKDFWGTSYRFELSGNMIKVISAGPDTQFDTSDDIYSKRTLD